MKLKPSKRFFYVALGVLAAALVAFYAIREIKGPFLPQVIDENFFTGLIVVLMGLFLWNRRIRSEEGRAGAAGESPAGKGAEDGGAREDAEARKDVDARD